MWPVFKNRCTLPFPHRVLQSRRTLHDCSASVLTSHIPVLRSHASLVCQKVSSLPGRDANSEVTAACGSRGLRKENTVKGNPLMLFPLFRSYDHIACACAYQQTQSCRMASTPPTHTHPSITISIVWDIFLWKHRKTDLFFDTFINLCGQDTGGKSRIFCMFVENSLGRRRLSLSVSPVRASDGLSVAATPPPSILNAGNNIKKFLRMLFLSLYPLKKWLYYISVIQRSHSVILSP